MEDIKEKSAECEYCNLVSGEEKEISEGYRLEMYLERHLNTYSLSVISHEGCVSKDINYCPMCGRKLV